MLDEEGVVARLENKVLHEGLWNVLVRLVELENFQNYLIISKHEHKPNTNHESIIYLH